MQLSREKVEELRTILREDGFGDFSAEEAKEMAEKILNYFEALNDIKRKHYGQKS